MYRRTGGVTNSAELRSPTEYPPDWDLLNLIDFEFTSSFSTPCLKEASILAPVKMKPAKTALAISAIGSMEEEIRPVKAVLDTVFQGFDLPEGISLESLIGDRDSGLNTPPPLPQLSDLSDYITTVDKAGGSGSFVQDLIKKEERKRFPTFSESSEDSALLDPSIENTVNLTQHFTLQNFASIESELVSDLNSETLYQEEDHKQLLVENQQLDQQQFIFDERSTAASLGERYGEQNIERSLFYLPSSVCQEVEELIEGEEEGNVNQQLQSINNFDGQCEGGSEIITISVEEFQRLAGDLNLLQGAGLVLDEPQVSANQVKALPIQPVHQSKPTQSTAASIPKQTERQDVEQTPPSGRYERKQSSSSGSSRKRRIASLDKESEEYRDKRARNNESVRRSRDKARQKQEESEDRMQILSNENRRLQDRVDSLEKELSVLRGLFTSTSTALPAPV